MRDLNGPGSEIPCGKTALPPRRPHDHHDPSGHVQLGEAQLGATLRLEPGRLTLEVASTGATPNMPERIGILLFTSSTGYFTLTDLFRHNHRMRLGVGGLSTYSARLAFESAHFPTSEED